MRDPKQLRFTHTHEWVDLEGEIATVGISRFAVDQLTDLIHIQLPKVGAKVTTGKSFGEVESVKAVSDLYSPLAGEVVEVNEAVRQDVQVLSADPYEQGWLIKLRVAPGQDLSKLLDHAGYEESIAEAGH
jgi:glycine cleavage system H protein